MKRMMIALLSVACLSGIATAGEWVPSGNGWTYENSTNFSRKAMVIPRGYHAHETVSGTIVHHDSNYGSAAAHEGVIGAGWPKTAFAGDTVFVADCPNGACPAGVRTRSSSSSYSYSSSSFSSSTSRRRGGWFPGKRVFEFLFR